MCQVLTISFECFCSKRVIKTYKKKNRCDCLFFIEFSGFKTSVCPICEADLTGLKYKLTAILQLASGEIDELFFDDPFYCVEFVYL